MPKSLSLREEVRESVKNCLDCHDICLQTVTHCLQMGGTYVAPGNIRLLLDCAEICQTASNFMLRGSDLHGWVSRVCADICLRCARDCQRFEQDEMMVACATFCNRCAESCTKVESLLALA